MRRLLVHFARYGPYHHTRLSSAASVIGSHGWEVMGLETAGNDATYAWDEAAGISGGPRVITAFPSRVYEEITAAECKQTLHPLLDSLSPDAIAIAGWASPDALSCLSWCRKNDRRRIVMSETREADGKRVWWKETIKRYLISRFDGALVGGKSHRDYLVKLGMSADKIHFGYNVVDNAYFAAEAEKWRNADCCGLANMKSLQESGDFSSSSQPSTINSQLSTSAPYFLASNRFIERKNLSRLIEAYSSYIQRSTINSQPSIPWNLCLVGDGELKSSLITQSKALGLHVLESAPWESLPSPDFQSSGLRSPTSGIVFFSGFRQIGELPRFYAHAGCFVHPALEEPWGLVLNEAMACGLPILSSRNVGAAEELVKHGPNGFVFDANNVAEMAQYLECVARLDRHKLAAMGAASSSILDETCPTKAFGKGIFGVVAGDRRSKLL